MELQTGGLDQKLSNTIHGADETQICTTDCTVATLENRTSSGGNDRELVSETQKGQHDKKAGDQSNFAELGKKLEDWVQSQLHKSQLNSSVLVEPTDEHPGESAEIDITQKSGQKSMATVLHSWVHDDQQRFPEIAKMLLENRSLSRKERWSRLDASGQHLWEDYRRNGSYSGGRVGHPFKHQRKKVFMYRCTSV